AGLQAWLVSASTEGRDHVRPEWPSPRQFDHCIAAVQVPAGTGLAAVEEETPLGPLLFFDPTDPLTPLGGLPENLQGSWVLLEHPSKGALLRLPIAQGRACGSQSTLRAEIDSTGGLTATWASDLRGSPARRERDWWAQGESRRRERFERALAD